MEERANEKSRRRQKRQSTRPGTTGLAHRIHSDPANGSAKALPEYASIPNEMIITGC